MYPILACLVVGLAIILERGVALVRKKIVPYSIIDATEAVRDIDDIPTLKKICEDDKSALATVILTAISHFDWPKNENLEAIQTKARVEINKMERGLVFLEICIGIGPLLGLLGTVSGLMRIFQGLGTASSDLQTQIIAHGIAEALNNTVAGIGIAIPALIAWSYFSRKIESAGVLMESVCTDLLSKVYRS